MQHTFQYSNMFVTLLFLSGSGAMIAVIVIGIIIILTLILIVLKTYNRSGDIPANYMFHGLVSVLGLSIYSSFFYPSGQDVLMLSQILPVNENESSLFAKTCLFVQSKNMFN